MRLISKDWKMKKSILILVTLMLTLIGSNLINQAQAADNPMTIMTINGSILPEYDNKYLLELYTVTMRNSSDKPFSGELTWRLPKQHLNEFVSLDQDLTKNKTIGNVRKFKDYDELFWKPSQPIPPKGIVTWHIEYYDLAAIQGETDKSFTYSFKQPYKIELASLVVLQPTKATNFQLVPAPEQQKQSQQGQLYGYSIKSGQPNQEKTIKINYTKTDPNPSFSQNNSTVAVGDSTGQIGSGTTTTTNSNKNLMYLLIVLIILIAGAAIILINKNQINEQMAKKARTLKADFEENEIDEEIDLEDLGLEDDSEDDDKDKIKNKLKKDLKNGMITESEYYEKLAELE